MGDATGVGGGVALPVAPLDTGFRRYDNSGCAGRQVLLVAEGGGPAAAGRPFESLRVIGFSKRPYGGVGEWGMRRGLVVGVALPVAPLDTGFRRYDNSGCAGRQVLLVAEGGGPAAAGRALLEPQGYRIREAPLGWVGSAPPRPFDRLRANGFPGTRPR